MVLRRELSVALLALVVPLAGCGEEESVGSMAEPTPPSSTLECENPRRNSGTPDYAFPATPNTEAPLAQAQRFAGGSGMRRDYPDVEAVAAEQTPGAQVIALVSEGKSVGILRYEDDEQLGWHLTAMETCSPRR